MMGPPHHDDEPPCQAVVLYRRTSRSAPLEKSERGPARPDRPGGRSGFRSLSGEVPMHRHVSRDVGPHRDVSLLGGRCLVSDARRASSIRLRRRSELSWQVCVARTAFPSCAAVRGAPRVCITAGRRSFWRPARSGFRATPPGKPPRAKSKSCAARCVT